MPNAWFYYAIPIMVPIALVIGGLLVFSRFPRGNTKKLGPSAMFFGTFMVAVGTLALAILLLSSPSPWHRQAIFDHTFSTPPDRIERFVIQAASPNQYQPLTKTQVVIDDAVRIRQIADILRAAREVSPNHPRTRWTARIEIVTRDCSYYFGVNATVSGDANGTLLDVWSNPEGTGWNLGDVRVDGLEKVLEDAVNAAK